MCDTIRIKERIVIEEAYKDHCVSAAFTLNHETGLVDVWLDGGFIDSDEPFFQLDPETIIKMGEKLTEMGKQGLKIRGVQ